MSKYPPSVYLPPLLAEECEYMEGGDEKKYVRADQIGWLRVLARRAAAMLKHASGYYLDSGAVGAADAALDLANEILDVLEAER